MFASLLQIASILFPRFELAVAAGGRAALLKAPAALAPEPSRTGGAGAAHAIGEVSATAETFGVRPGMRLSEALARCPQLTLVPPDPAGVADAWEHVLGRLEAIGAAVDSPRPGIVSFAVGGLRGIHGGRVEGVLEAARRTLRAGGPAGAGARIGAAPTPFCALAAAVRARPRRDEVVRGDAAAYLAPRKVALLRAQPGPATLVQPLERLGILTLGELAGLPRDAVADRFGAVGLYAHDLASGRELPLHPRRPGERVSESLELPEAASGLQLQRALDVLVDRLLARGDRRARTLRAVTVSARLVEGGTWRERVPFREATADPARIRLALTVPLGRLPAPAAMLALTIEDFGPPAADQRALIGEEEEERRRRLREAVRHLRATGGSDAALRVLLVDEGSRVPERRSLLTPFEP